MVFSIFFQIDKFFLKSIMICDFLKLIDSFGL